MRTNRSWANALTDNFVCTEYRDYACPFCHRLSMKPKAGWACTSYNVESMQDFGLKIGVGGCYAVGVYWALYGTWSITISSKVRRCGPSDLVKLEQEQGAAGVLQSWTYSSYLTPWGTGHIMPYPVRYMQGTHDFGLCLCSSSTEVDT